MQIPCEWFYRRQSTNIDFQNERETLFFRWNVLDVRFYSHCWVISQPELRLLQSQRFRQNKEAKTNNNIHIEKVPTFFLYYSCVNSFIHNNARMLAHSRTHHSNSKFSTEMSETISKQTVNCEITLQPTILM